LPATALGHFDEDIARARAILICAKTLPATSNAERLLRSDLFRSAWMFAVGAVDAYFCDAYTDIVAAALSSKSRQVTVKLPDFFYEIRLPVRTFLEDYTNKNWRWRMAARRMMDRENVLNLQTIQRLFNKFFRKGFRFFNDLMDTWLRHADANVRLFRVTEAEYLALNPADQATAREQAMESLDNRFSKIFQRRHDCIHNCDRPKMRPQALASSHTVLKVIQDVEFLVNRCDEHIDSEFRQFLEDIGCSATTIGLAGYA
jgi:hypothetical protein